MEYFRVRPGIRLARVWWRPSCSLEIVPDFSTLYCSSVAIEMCCEGLAVHSFFSQGSPVPRIQQEYESFGIFNIIGQ